MNRVAIMQPYFFPYLGYFSLIKHTDLFILFDVVQFIRHGWIERNRILHPQNGWLYIQVPLVKKSRETFIKDMQIQNNNGEWKKRILSQIQHYKKIAPFYLSVLDILQDVFSFDYDTITSLNQYSLKKVCQYLNIQRDFPIFSEMGLSIEKPQMPDEWALNICKAMEDVEEYWNPPGGQSFFDRSKYEQAGIKLRFQSVNLKEYDQRRKPFEPGLSIIDVMMFNSPEEINQMLDDYSLF